MCWDGGNNPAETYLRREKTMNFLFVALGGALGAMGRYAISQIPAKGNFPILTLATNLSGAVLIGFIVGISERNPETSPHMILFWKTGVCGGFTTFSTFSLEALTLFENKSYAPGVIYVILSVGLCISGAYLGRKMAAAF